MNDWYRSLNERERRVVLLGGIAALVLLILAVLLPLDRSVASAHSRIARKQGDLAWMRGVAPFLAAAPAPPAGATPRSLVALVDGSAREAGLAGARSEPAGQNGLRVRLDKASFDSIVGWLARLSDQHGIRVDSATIDSAGSPGLVNAGIVLHAP